MLKILGKISDCETIDEVWALHTAYMATFGFDRMLYGYTRFKSDNSLGDPLDTLMLTNFGQDYIEGFVNSGLYFHGPMLRWTLENTGACSWNWMEQLSLEDAYTKGERRALEFNRKMGVTAGYTISFPSSSVRNKGGIALVANPDMNQNDVDRLWEKSGKEILTINNMVHLKIISLPYSSSRRALTPRQREVLEWVGEGKIMQEIGIIMSLTPATIEKHLRLAREALDVETTAQAVLKASFQNQIFVLES
jgi:LuxR family transcriptional regulator